MIEVVRQLTLPVWQATAFDALEIRQGNLHSIFFSVRFIDEKCNVVPLPPNAKPRMEFKKPDGKTVLRDGIMDAARTNAFVIEIVPQCLATAGNAIMDFKVSDAGTTVLVGAQATIKIMPSAVDPGGIISTDDYQTLQKALANVENADQTSKEALVRAGEALTLLTPSVTAAEKFAESASKSETNAAASAAASVQSKTAATTSERAAKLSETNAKASETNAATSATAAGQSKTAAEASAGKAAASETNAATSAAAAAQSKTAAEASEGKAAASETNAAASANAARLSETNANEYAKGADASEIAAGQSKTAAETSAGKALVSETKATAAATRAETLANQMDGVGVHRYGILWDGVNAACTRMYNAVGMVAAAHLGTFNPALKNDFDSVYPWCDMKLCNWVAGTATEKAKITAFEGEPNFDLTANIGAYRPEFWYKVEQQANGGILKVVADGKLPGYIYNPAYMSTAFCEGKDAAGKVTCKIGGTRTYDTSLNDYNTLNAANGMLTEDYWRDGAEKLLMEVELANMNSQNATGAGFTQSRYSDDRPAFAETAANRVIFTKAVAEQYVAEKQTIGIGTTWFSGFKANFRKILSITPHTDPLYSCVNFDGAPVNIETTDHVGSMSAVYDNAVGHASGYVGINGKSISYYRGKALQTGAWMWIANILRDSSEKLWLAPQDTPQTGTIGADWIESGIAIPQADGYIKGLSVSKKCPLLVQTSAVGGNTTNPVGDYFYRPAVGTSTTAFLSRGNFCYGAYAGASCGYWRYSPSSADWYFSACALIVSPFGGAGVATPVKPD